jgi:hypothetical protein
VLSTQKIGYFLYTYWNLLIKSKTCWQTKNPVWINPRNSPITIPHSLENTKFPTMEEKMKQLIKDWEEALAAHELACMHKTEWQKSNFIPFKVGDEVWLDSRNLKTIYHKKWHQNARDHSR